MNKVQDAYAILGVAADTPPLHVRRAYIRLVRDWHPDRFANDPRLQLRAVEMLKSINEAYELVRAEHGAGQAVSSRPSSVDMPKPGPDQNLSAEERGSKLNSGKSPAVSGLLAGGLTLFFQKWQNCAFVLLTAAVLYVAHVRYGSIYYGGWYAFEMLALPGIFALACNFSWFAPRRNLWRGYVAVVCLFAMIVLYDSLLFSSRQDEAFIPGDSTSEPGVSVRGYSQSLPEGSPEAGMTRNRRYPVVGPMAPVSPQVNVPDAPLAPVAPLAPAAPLAAPAR